ncbi:molybdate ABC transporter substrate-binding protein [Jiella sp. M17.18]|uniref:molybdate ABC transporter substrate-binding protein n=1 Tax=Jiella sp. M17.18 TaxID=3234247 RepID=UPI0034DE37E8
MMDIKLLSGGAANGLVSALTQHFTTLTGHGIAGEFSAVGAMRDRVRSGEPVDVLILTKSVIEALAEEGAVDADSITDVGNVVTGVAVRAGMPVVDVSTPEALKAALAEADSVYLPDPGRATAGIHFARVLERLGVAEALKDRLRPFPNGQTAMAQMAAAADRQPIGCTQVTEILNTPGVVYCGALPDPCGLVTTYTAAVAARAADPEAALSLVRLLTSPQNAALRDRTGFSPA